MTDTTKTFHQRLRESRPDVVEHQKKNGRKRAIAIKLRDLRDAKNMTPGEVAEATGMTRSTIARLEALSGRVPQLETIERYVTACGGHMALVISAEALDPPDDAVV